MIADAEALKIEAANKQKEYNQKLQSVKKLKEAIGKLKEDNHVKISEHAIIRYFERVKGFNIPDIEKEILTQEILDLVEKLGGNGKYPNKGFSVVMKNYCVTTIV